MFTNLLISLLLVLVANSVLSALVPRLDNKNIQLTPFAENAYSFKLRHSDGYVLEELVEKTAPGQYKVKGRLNQPYYVPGGRAVVTYETKAENNRL